MIADDLFVVLSKIIWNNFYNATWYGLKNEFHWELNKITGNKRRQSIRLCLTFHFTLGAVVVQSTSCFPSLQPY